MKVYNSGSSMHLPGSVLERGAQDVDDKVWAEAKKLPKVKEAIKCKRLVENYKAPAAAKREPVKADTVADAQKVVKETAEALELAKSALGAAKEPNEKEAAQKGVKDAVEKAKAAK